MSVKKTKQTFKDLVSLSFFFFSYLCLDSLNYECCLDESHAQTAWCVLMVV